MKEKEPINYSYLSVEAIVRTINGYIDYNIRRRDRAIENALEGDDTAVYAAAIYTAALQEHLALRWDIDRDARLAARREKEGQQTGGTERKEREE